MTIHRQKPLQLLQHDPLHRENDVHGAYNYVIQSDQYMYVNCNFQVLKNHVDQS